MIALCSKEEHGARKAPPGWWLRQEVDVAWIAVGLSGYFSFSLIAHGSNASMSSTV
tara:strand:+ start:14952 stop:15119 length:168 start_codon:yes stop_codon:yes gene_type:complete